MRAGSWGVPRGAGAPGKGAGWEGRAPQHPPGWLQGTLASAGPVQPHPLGPLTASATHPRVPSSSGGAQGRRGVSGTAQGGCGGWCGGLGTDLGSWGQVGWVLGTAKGAGVSPGCRGQLRLGAGVSSEWVPGTARGAGWAQGTAGAGCWDSPWRPPGPGRRKPPVTAGAGVLARRGGFGVTGRAPGAGRRAAAGTAPARRAAGSPGASARHRRRQDGAQRERQRQGGQG